MTRASLTYDLLCSASYDVIDAAYAANVREPKSPALGLLARIGLWLRLLWGGGGAVSAPLYYRPAPSPNRAQLRRGRRSAPLGRQLCALAPLLWRVHGRARYERFLYDLGSYGRVKFCFQNWNWRWAVRLYFATCAALPDMRALCHAPLYPD